MCMSDSVRACVCARVNVCKVLSVCQLSLKGLKWRSCITLFIALCACVRACVRASERARNVSVCKVTVGLSIKLSLEGTVAKRFH